MEIDSPTVRTHLRPMTLSDIDDFMIWATDKKVARFCTWEPYTCREDGIAFINDTVLPHPWFRAICLEDDRPIGSISVTPVDNIRGEIGYVIGSKYWGKGIATAAVRMVAAEIFKEKPEMERLEGLVDVDNVGSQKVLEKVGFVREGVMRNFMRLKGHIRDMTEFDSGTQETVVSSPSSGRISLRRMTLSDVDDYMVWATDAEVARFCSWEPCKSRDEAIQYITDSVLTHPWLKAICLEDDRAIGYILIMPVDNIRKEIGYVLGRKYWGKGLATEAVRMVTAEIFKEMPEIKRLEALVDVDNVGSQKVLEKVGFTREGVMRKFICIKGSVRDTVMFSFLASDTLK